MGSVGHVSVLSCGGVGGVRGGGEYVGVVGGLVWSRVWEDVMYVWA